MSYHDTWKHQLLAAEKRPWTTAWAGLPFLTIGKMQKTQRFDRITTFEELEDLFGEPFAVVIVDLNKELLNLLTGKYLEFGMPKKFSKPQWKYQVCLPGEPMFEWYLENSSWSNQLCEAFRIHATYWCNKGARVHYYGNDETFLTGEVIDTIYNNDTSVAFDGEPEADRLPIEYLFPASDQKRETTGENKSLVSSKGCPRIGCPDYNISISEMTCEFTEENFCPKCGFPGFIPKTGWCRHQNLRLGYDGFIHCMKDGCNAKFSLLDNAETKPLKPNTILHPPVYVVSTHKYEPASTFFAELDVRHILKEEREAKIYRLKPENDVARPPVEGWSWTFK